jgi:hypothetical protein
MKNHTVGSGPIKDGKDNIHAILLALSMDKQISICKITKHFDDEIFIT